MWRRRISMQSRKCHHAGRLPAQLCPRLLKKQPQRRLWLKRKQLQKNAARAKAQKLQIQADRDLKQGRFASAADTFTEALAANKENAGTWAGRGRAYLRTSRLQEALSDLNEALQLDSKLVAAIADRGEVKMHLDDLAGSIDDYDKYLALAPCDGRVLYQRGSAKQRQGRKDEAAKDFSLAKRLGHTGSPRPMRGGC